ncbi:hypothetical protein ACM61V_13075 [Sphingomonas sp. TX0543]|uniref:hypothetical protein n=1 Tax=unclassified Sphingomonas TaxID=196159 RepID=UPI0010F5E523|nr:hypothetical protein [Sphingomonas sp. 3P27F8]
MNHRDDQCITQVRDPFQASLAEQPLTYMRELACVRPSSIVKSVRIRDISGLSCNADRRAGFMTDGAGHTRASSLDADTMGAKL